VGVADVHTRIPYASEPRREVLAVIGEGSLVVLGVADAGKADLLEVAGALHLLRLTAGPVQGRQEDRDQDRDDRDDHEELDQREPVGRSESVSPLHEETSDVSMRRGGTTARRTPG